MQPNPTQPPPPPLRADSPDGHAQALIRSVAGAMDERTGDDGVVRPNDTLRRQTGLVRRAVAALGADLSEETRDAWRALEWRLQRSTLLRMRALSEQIAGLPGGHQEDAVLELSEDLQRRLGGLGKEIEALGDGASPALERAWRRLRALTEAGGSTFRGRVTIRPRLAFLDQEDELRDGRAFSHPARPPRMIARGRSGSGVFDVERGAKLWEDGGDGGRLIVSPDGRFVLDERFVLDDSSHPVLYDLDSGRVVWKQGAGRASPVRWFEPSRPKWQAGLFGGYCFNLWSDLAIPLAEGSAVHLGSGAPRWRSAFRWVVEPAEVLYEGRLRVGRNLYAGNLAKWELHDLGTGQRLSEGHGHESLSAATQRAARERNLAIPAAELRPLLRSGSTRPMPAGTAKVFGFKIVHTAISANGRFAAALSNQADLVVFDLESRSEWRRCVTADGVARRLATETQKTNWGGRQEFLESLDTTRTGPAELLFLGGGRFLFAPALGLRSALWDLRPSQPRLVPLPDWSARDVAYQRWNDGNLLAVVNHRTGEWLVVQ